MRDVLELETEGDFDGMAKAKVRRLNKETSLNRLLDAMAEEWSLAVSWTYQMDAMCCI